MGRLEDVNDDDPSVYIVGPAAVILGYRGLVFRYSANRGVTIGTPIFEAAGVLNRRGAIAYPFSGTELAELWIRAVANGDIASLTPRYQMPANWRYPPLP